MEWARLLAYITGTVDQELLLRNEYLAAENPPGVGEGHARRSPGRDPLCRWKKDSILPTPRRTAPSLRSGCIGRQAALLR